MHEKTHEGNRESWTDGTPPPAEGGVGGFISHSEPVQDEPKPCGLLSDIGLTCERDAEHDGQHESREQGCHAAWGKGYTPTPVQDERTALKEGKLQLELVDLDFVEDMARQLHAGLVPPRVADGWRELDPREWVRKYRGAVLRHLVCASREFGAVDPDTGATHWAGVAVNAMICAVLEASALKREG